MPERKMACADSRCKTQKFFWRYFWRYLSGLTRSTIGEWGSHYRNIHGETVFSAMRPGDSTDESGQTELSSTNQPLRHAASTCRDGYGCDWRFRPCTWLKRHQGPIHRACSCSPWSVARHSLRRSIQGWRLDARESRASNWCRTAKYSG